MRRDRGVRPTFSPSKALEEEPEGGIGLVVVWIKDSATFCVTELDRQGPAFVAGIREGDRLVSVDGCRLKSEVLAPTSPLLLLPLTFKAVF
mmetsp:Transcript_57963/g.121152  ORF Transcript_57963/g.121152 Transcript_57963/m.121152 type:complete len:91 (+) Transcript_57963:85-357(+)